MVSNGKIRIAIDAMGGDFAPKEIVKGAVQAAEESDIEIILVGNTTAVEAELSNYEISRLPIRVVAANDVIKEEDDPAFAVYRKPNASIVVASKMVKAGEADALLGAGPTGAFAISAIRFMGTVEGISRPALGGPIEVLSPKTILVDCGANVDCKPHQLLSFAIIGTVYAKKLRGIENPTVALLNVGKEPGKGNELTKEAYELFKKSNLNFIGFVEGNDIVNDKANVIVCDGFVGNVIIKFYEVVGPQIAGYVKQKYGGDGGGFFSPLKRVLKQTFSLTGMTDSMRTGGGLLWGIDGVAMKMHGNVQASHVYRTILLTRDSVNADVVNCLKIEMKKINQN